MKVPFFDLTPQFSSIEEEIKSALDEVFKTQQFILGPKVEASGAGHRSILSNTVRHWSGFRIGCPAVIINGAWELELEMRSSSLPSPSLPRLGLFLV